MDTLFLSGHTYYNDIKSRPNENHKWYESLYIVYYENFKVLVVLVICILLYHYISLPCSTNEKQSGGFTPLAGVKSKAGRVSKIFTLNRATKNMGKTASAIKSIGQKETYKKLGRKAVSGVKTGYAKGKELGAQGLQYGREGIARGADEFKENSAVIYKYIALIFLGIGFTMYIFPILAMFLMGALTFLIVRKDIANLITA
jgi:hypothetical protein